jgi:two-component system, sensor histidine kinase YesM
MKNTNYHFFIKNFLLLLIPLLFPLLILGTVSTIVTREFVKEEINKNNLNLLRLTKDNLELIFNEMDALNLNFSTNPEITTKLKKILCNSVSTVTLDEFNTLKMIQDFLNAPANARSYIDSIYVYFNNPYRRVITTTEGLTNLNSFYDTSWYQSYTRLNIHHQIWTEPRQIRRYAFENSAKDVLTIYRRLYTPGNPNAGVIVLNIKMKYIANIIKNSEVFSGQGIIIADENNRILFRNSTTHVIREKNLKKIIKGPNVFVYHSSQGDFTVTYLASGKYHWKYISIVPQKTLYKVPMKLQGLTLYLLFFSLMLGLVLTYWVTRNNYLRMQNIISIIDSAKKGSPLPALSSKINDEYGLITYDILTTFIEQNYLKLQLSERKFKLQAMELLALQSQINPHFLYNTLDTIKWRIIGITRKPNETSTMLENLSDILKYSLGTPEQMVPLVEEIKNTRNYVDILKILYKDKFDLIWDCEETVMGYPVIRLLFQPLIENSIYHGIKEKEGHSIIKIKIQQQSGLLKIVVIDNGLGMKQDKLEEIRRSFQQKKEYSSHIGLYNTQKRLELIYGQRVSFHLNSKFGLGTVVTIKIPV